MAGVLCLPEVRLAIEQHLDVFLELALPVASTWGPQLRLVTFTCLLPT